MVRTLAGIAVAAVACAAGCAPGLFSGDDEHDSADGTSIASPSTSGGSTTSGSSTSGGSTTGGTTTGGSTGLTTGGTTGGTTTGGTTGGSTGGAPQPSQNWQLDAFGSPIGFKPATIGDMLFYVNTERRSYIQHDRYRGLPSKGSSHQNVTWPYEMAWDAGLAQEAQAEADRLAGGGSPPGSAVPHFSTGKTYYLAGVNTSRYTYSSKEDPGDWDGDMFGQVPAALSKNNGAARQGIYYHDPGGSGPVLRRIGIGRADAGGGSTWWVIVLGT